jgi:circadian clock protein KaiC
MPDPIAAPTRVETGILGLDTVLLGGLLSGGTYLLVGGPGTGKTILSNQICSHRAALGEHAVYVSVLAESHTRMLTNLRSLSFFQPDFIGSRISYVSGFSVLESEGPDGLRKMLLSIIRKQRARILVVDSIASVLEYAESRTAARKFLRDLGTMCSLTGCVALMLTPITPERTVVELAMADGILRLRRHHRDLRDVRTLEVVKSRGSGPLEGRHIFDISDDGLRIHPRTEVLLKTDQAAREPYEPLRRVPFGGGVDQLLGEGILAGSTTALLGPPGSGKTLFGLQFLATGVEHGEKGFYFGFYEPPARLIAKAEGVGISLGRYVERGDIQVLWQPSSEHTLDVLAERLLACIYATGVKRLFLDGLDGIKSGSFYRERFSLFFSAITNRLRMLGVTTAVSEELALFSNHPERPGIILSASCDNIIHARYKDVGSRSYRLISVVKARDGDHDASIREFFITGSGITVADDSSSAEALQRDEQPRSPAKRSPVKRSPAKSSKGRRRGPPPRRGGRS